MILDLIPNVVEREKQKKCHGKYRYKLYHEFIKIVQTYLICE